MKEEQLKSQILLGLSVFDADYLERQWVANDDIKNVIPFSAFKSDGKGNAIIHYDKYDEKLVTDPLLQNDSNMVILPEVLLQAPFAHDTELIAKLNQFGPENRFLIVGEDFRNRFFLGRLPEILLGNDRWTVDGYLQQIRLTREPWKVIDFDALIQTDSGVEMIYDKKKHKDATWDLEHATKLPKEWSYLQLPSIFLMDPLGLARREGIHRLAYAIPFGIQQLHEAKVLSMDPVKKAIERNRVAKGLPAQEELEKKGTRQGKKTS